MLNNSMLRFTIREVLLFTVIVAVLVSWWLDHRKGNIESRRLEEGWNSTKKELQTTKKVAELDRKIVREYRRKGWSDILHKDGTVTVGVKSTIHQTFNGPYQLVDEE